MFLQLMGKPFASMIGSMESILQNLSDIPHRSWWQLRRVSCCSTWDNHKKRWFPKMGVSQKVIHFPFGYPYIYIYMKQQFSQGTFWPFNIAIESYHLQLIFPLNMVIFQFAMWVLTRGSIPYQNPMKPSFSHGFPMVFLWFSYGNLSHQICSLPLQAERARKIKAVKDPLAQATFERPQPGMTREIYGDFYGILMVICSDE